MQTPRDETHIPTGKFLFVSACYAGFSRGIPRVRTLILDDDPVYLAVAEGVLRSLGIHDVVTQQEGSAALGTITDADPPFELVLLDLNMPSFDGLAFLRALAEVSFAGGVILVSGEKKAILSSARHIAQQHGLKIFGALSKPMQLGEMRDALERAHSDAATPPSAVRVQHSGPTADLVPMLYYQSQVDVVSRANVGAEALLRCGTREGLVLGPDPLLKANSADHLQFQLTKQLFGILCKDMRVLREAGWTNSVSFNAGARVFEMDGLTDALKDILDEHGVSAHEFTIELTEAQLPRDHTRLLEVIARLGIAGFELSLDDFGTGASNFELLREGAFSEVKLDRSIVQAAISGEELSRKFVRIAAESAESLEIRLIAEGIENERDAQMMTEFGVHIVQGYHFSKPLPVDKFIEKSIRSARQTRQAS